MRGFIFSFFIILFLLDVQVANAQMRRGTFRSTKVGATTYNYTGANKTSFSSGSPGYGAELSVDAGSGFTRYFFKARFNQSSGSQNFLHSGTTYFSNYEFYSIEPEIGFALFPVQRMERGLNIYLWGVGNASYNYLELKSIPTTINVDPKGQALALGFGAGLGFEFVMRTTKDGKRLMLYSEIGFRQSQVTLAGVKNFEVGGMTASLGFGF